MTLEEFAKSAGVRLEECGPEWGGRIAYRIPDSPNCAWCGYRTEQAAYKAWLVGTFGEHTAKAVMKLLREKKGGSK